MRNNINKFFSAVVKSNVETISSFERTKTVQTKNIDEILSRGGSKHE